MAGVAGSLADALRDRYVLERELGRGGMATVWLARDLKHGRPVALKVLHPGLAASLGPERFQREIQVAARLQHPHILTVLDSGEAAGQLWFTMPYVEGDSLRARLRRAGQLSVEETLRIARSVAAALDYAHAKGVIHRDIKPENILLHQGEPMVADFGISLAPSRPGQERLTETGLVLGTPAYMSPEQASASQKLDGRSDQYSLACVVYEMLAGEPPYTGPTACGIIANGFSQPVPHLSTVRAVPRAVEEAVTGALAKTPADRFPTAGAFVAALCAPAGMNEFRRVSTMRRIVALARAAMSLLWAGCSGIPTAFAAARCSSSAAEPDRPCTECSGRTRQEMGRLPVGHNGGRPGPRWRRAHRRGAPHPCQPFCYSKLRGCDHSGRGRAASRRAVTIRRGPRVGGTGH